MEAILIPLIESQTKPNQFIDIYLYFILEQLTHKFSSMHPEPFTACCNMWIPFGTNISKSPLSNIALLNLSSGCGMVPYIQLYIHWNKTTNLRFIVFFYEICCLLGNSLPAQYAWHNRLIIQISIWFFQLALFKIFEETNHLDKMLTHIVKIVKKKERKRYNILNSVAFKSILLTELPLDRFTWNKMFAVFRSMCNKLKDFCTLKNLFITICTILAGYLVGKAVFKFVVIKPTSTSNEIVELNAETIPDVVICGDPAIDQDLAKDYGYKHPAAYWHGTKDGYSGNFIGWNGILGKEGQKNSTEIRDDLLNVKMGKGW